MPCLHCFFSCSFVVYINLEPRYQSLLPLASSPRHRWVEFVYLFGDIIAIKVKWTTSSSDPSWNFLVQNYIYIPEANLLLHRDRRHDCLRRWRHLRRYQPQISPMIPTPGTAQQNGRNTASSGLVEACITTYGEDSHTTGATS